MLADTNELGCQMIHNLEYKQSISKLLVPMGWLDFGDRDPVHATCS